MFEEDLDEMDETYTVESIDPTTAVLKTSWGTWNTKRSQLHPDTAWDNLKVGDTVKRVSEYTDGFNSPLKPSLINMSLLEDLPCD